MYYTYLPFFYSDLFEMSYEAIGEISSDMQQSSVGDCWTKGRMC